MQLSHLNRFQCMTKKLNVHKDSRCAIELSKMMTDRRIELVINPDLHFAHAWNHLKTFKCWKVHYQVYPNMYQLTKITW